MTHMRASAPSCEFDVLILGAGPAGAGLALALRRAGVARVLLADRPARQPFRIGESAAPSLGALLRRLGLDDRLQSHGHRPCHGNLSVWGGSTLLVDDFMKRGCGPGWHLDREKFDAWLRVEAMAKGAELLSPASLGEVRADRDCWQASLRANGGKFEVSARWIVDATGRPAAFARRSGARLHRIDRLIALAARAEPAANSGFGGFSLVEAVDIGWWYAARLPGGPAVVALMTDADLASAADLPLPDVFRESWAATSQICRFVPPPPDATRPAIFAAGSQFLDRAVGRQWLALGDALIAFDPLSAAGITGALEDAIAAADTIVGQLDGSGNGERLDLRAKYAARADATLKRYLDQRLAIYGGEKRWAGGSFWERRTMMGPEPLQRSA